MRLFFAVLLEPAVRECLAQTQERLKVLLSTKGVNWLKPDNFHFTLHFLGDMTAEQASLACEAGREAASVLTPFQILVGGLGVFPSRRGARVLWIGAESGEDGLNWLHLSLADALLKRSFTVESRHFHAHLTLARFNSPHPHLSDAIEALHEHETVIQSVKSFSLLASQLKPSGAVYTEVERFQLSAPQ